VIPNRKIAGEILHNYGKIRQVGIAVTVAHGSDVAAALSLVRGILEANPRVLKEPVPYLGAGQITPNGIDLVVGPWVAVPDLRAATSELNQAILAEFGDRGIELARPYRDVKLVDVPAERLQSSG
jgi:small conductance mechanosensitive channel